MSRISSAILIHLFILFDVVTSLSWYRNFGTTIDNSGCRSEDTQPIVEYYKIDDYQYMFFSERVSWDEAETICPIYDAQLAIVNTALNAYKLTAAISESNIDMEDIWIGGQRSGKGLWTWINNESIPAEPIDGFPPWVRKPNRPWKQCVAIDRFTADSLIFVDLDCRLPKPFICQRDVDGPANPDVTLPSHMVTIGKNTYILYHSRISWATAAAFCRMRGYRLAIIPNNKIAKIISTAMVRSRPSFDYMWISGHFSHKKWRWLSTGDVIPNYPDKNNYPPWYSATNHTLGGCILLDRHMCEDPVFLVSKCDRKRDFICEKYSKKIKRPIEFGPIKIAYKNWTMHLFLKDLSWHDAQEYCSSQNAYLTEVYDYDMMRAITTVMSDQESEPVHVWLGGMLINGKWIWVNGNKLIPTTTDKTSFVPWCDIEEKGNNGCLNMDREAHDKPVVYGLKCKLKQPFVCTSGTPNKRLRNTRIATAIRSTLATTTVRPNTTTTSTTTTKMAITTTTPTTTTEIATTTVSTTLEITTPTTIGTTPKPIVCDQEPIVSPSAKDKVIVTFFTPIKFADTFKFCAQAGGDLATITGRQLNIITEQLWNGTIDCAERHIWTAHSNMNCTYIDYGTKKSMRSKTCTDSKGCMCEIYCDRLIHKSAMFKNNIWNCSDQNNAKICYVSCKYGSVLEGVNKLVCSNAGWVDAHSNKTSLLPICQDERKAAMDLIKWFKDFRRNQYKILYVLDESISISTEQWWQQLQFIASLTQAFPASQQFPFGLIMYHNSAKVLIPFNTTDTCGVLETLYQMRPDPTAQLSFYNKALEMANRQIKTFQGNETVVIFFLTSTPNVGDEFDDILNRLKIKHKIFAVGITDDPIYNLVTLASKMYDKSLLFMFKDFISLTAAISIISNHRSPDLDCPERLYTLPKASLCRQNSMSIYDGGITYTAFFNRKSYTSAQLSCIDAGGSLADFSQRDLKGIVSKIMNEAKTCTAIELWIHAGRLPCASIAISHRKVAPYAKNCSEKHGEICEISCANYPTAPKYNRNIWNCTKTAAAHTCYITCKGDSVLKGSDTITCTTKGWTIGINDQITYFPICLGEEMAFKKILTAIKYLVQETDGFLFVIDKSGLVSNPDWKPLQIVTNIIQVFPISEQYPFGLIVFDEDAEAVIPYNATDTCQVLNQIKELRLETPTNDSISSSYKSALKEAEHQILTFQPRRRTVIFFLSDRSSNGDGYIATLSALKERHVMFSIGIGNHSLNDLQYIASVYNDRLLIYKFNSHRIYNEVTKRMEGAKSKLTC